MHRLIVAILAAVDAAIAAAVGIAATLAPLTLLWVFGLGGTADWGAALARRRGGLAVRQSRAARTSRCPAITSRSPASIRARHPSSSRSRRSRSRRSRRSSPPGRACAPRRPTRGSPGVRHRVGGVRRPRRARRADLREPASPTVELWQAILFPTLVFALPALAAPSSPSGARRARASIARLRDRVEAAPHGWGEVPGLIARGTAVVVAGLVGLGALAVAVALVLRGGEVIALYEAAQRRRARRDGGHPRAARLPARRSWSGASPSSPGPGFAVGAGTAVSPAGTQARRGARHPACSASLPESTTPWLLLLALLPVALGALAGLDRPLAARRRRRRRGRAAPRARPDRRDAAPDAAAARRSTALLAGAARRRPAQRRAEQADSDARRRRARRIRPTRPDRRARSSSPLGIAVLSAAAAALLAAAGVGFARPGPARRGRPAAGTRRARRRTRGAARRGDPAALAATRRPKRAPRPVPRPRDERRRRGVRRTGSPATTADPPPTLRPVRRAIRRGEPTHRRPRSYAAEPASSRPTRSRPRPGRPGQHPDRRPRPRRPRPLPPVD